MPDYRLHDRLPPQFRGRYGAFLIAGSASADVTGVRVYLIPSTSGGTPNGAEIALDPGRGHFRPAGGRDTRARWFMYLPGRSSGNGHYVYRVELLSGGNSTPQPRVTTPIEKAEPYYSSQFVLTSAAISTSIPDSQDPYPLSPDEKLYFVAMGHSHRPTQTAWMDGANPPPDNTNPYVDRSTDDQWWWAIFDPLDTGNYVLRYADDISDDTHNCTVT